MTIINRFGSSEPTVHYCHLLGRLSFRRSATVHLVDYCLPLGDFAEDDVLAVEPAAGHEGDEELRAVGVLAGVGHREQVGLGVLQGEVLVLKLLTVDGLSSGSVVVGEVSALGHEVLDDPVEGGPLVAEALLPRAEGPEVLGGQRDHVGKELEFDPLLSLSVKGNREKDLRVRHFKYF
jgi:hypothetical protein